MSVLILSTSITNFKTEIFYYENSEFPSGNKASSVTRMMYFII